MPGRDTRPAATPGRRLPSTQRLVLATGIVLLAAVLLTLAGLAWYEREQLFERVGERNELLARVFAEQATRNVEAGALAAATVAEQLQRGGAGPGTEAQAALRQTLLNLPFMRGMAVVDASGLVLLSAEPAEAGQRIDLRALGPLPVPGSDALGPYVPRRRLLDLALGGKPAATPAGAGFLPLLRGVPGPAGATRYVVALLNPAAFANFQQVTLNDTRAAAALVSYDGRLIVATAGVARQTGDSLSALPPFGSFLPRIEQGAWIGAGLREGTQIAAFRVSASRPLVVMVEFGREAAMADWSRRARGLFGAGVAALLLIGAMTRVATRSVRAREAARAERDLAQAQVERREHELSVTLQSLQELVFRTDAQGHITFTNQRWSALTGRAAHGCRLWDVVLPAQREAVRALFAGADPGAVPRGLQATFTEHDGVQRSFDIAVMPLHEGSRLVGHAGSAVEVTARVVAQQRLQTQLAFTELLMEVVPLPCSVVDLRRRYVLVNRAWERFTGRPRAEVIGQPVGAHLPLAEQEADAAQDRRLLQGGQPLRFESAATHHDGSTRDVVVDKLLLPGDDGRPAGILSVLIDVTEFRDAERATREARDVAEDASRAKSEFIANISHELRTPLQTIIGFSELGLLRGREQPKLAAMFEDIHRAGQRMLALVNDLLDVAKIESTVGTIHLERSDLRGLVREAVHELQPLLASRRLQVALRLPELPMRAKVDPARCQQVLRNVLANAIKFSPEGGQIDVDGDHTEGGDLHLAIADRGPGIPPAELDSIFEAFVQSSQTKDGSGGTGLGLAICRKIVDAHGGRIHAENRAGGGAVFHLHLPARSAAETLPAPL